jgi:hypothetical protein
MTQSSCPTRLVEYINAMMPSAHGHQRKAIFDFITALVSVQSCCQAKLARFFGNQEAALKRLARFLRNERLDVQELARSTARLIVAQLPLAGPVRLAIDWTIEDKQHLLVASLMVGRRAVPLLWRAYAERELKARRSGYEREFIRTLVREVLKDVSVRRLILTADRAFADVEFFDLLNDLGVSFVIRSKSSVKVLVDGGWRKLSALRLKGNTRRRSLGRIFYCESSPHRQYVAQARVHDGEGGWGIWHLVSQSPALATGDDERVRAPLRVRGGLSRCEVDVGLRASTPARVSKRGRGCSPLLPSRCWCWWESDVACSPITTACADSCGASRRGAKGVRS